MTKFNHHDKKFRPVSNSENGETSKQTTFHYRQEGNVLIGENAGGNIRKGLLIGLVDEEGKIEMRYQQINDRNEFMTGICFSTPEVLNNGKISLYENEFIKESIKILCSKSDQFVKIVENPCRIKVPEQ